MKSRNILEVKGSATLGVLALALSAPQAFAAEPDAHAYVRDSILNTWTPTAVASPTVGKMEAHERARITIVGASEYPRAAAVRGAPDGPGVDAQEQARRLLLAQPAASQKSVVAIDGSRPGR